MREGNPYESPQSRLDESPEMRSKGADDCGAPRSKWKWALGGFVLFAFPPVAFGVHHLQQHYEFLASRGPNQLACGNAVIEGHLLIFVVGPFCGMVGAALGWAVAKMQAWRSSGP